MSFAVDTFHMHSQLHPFFHRLLNQQRGLETPKLGIKKYFSKKNGISMDKFDIDGIQITSLLLSM